MTIAVQRFGAQFPPAYHRPFLRYFEGEAGAGGTPTVQNPAPAEDPAPAAPTPEPAAPAADTPPWGDDFDADRAWKKIQAQKADIEAERSKRAKAVAEAEAAATQKAKEDAYREIGKQFGLVKDDEAPTVEGLSAALQDKDATLTAAEARNLSLTVENAVLRYADKHGADPDALTDSSSFTKGLKALDPAADDYASQVEALVKSTVESNSRYRKVQVTPKSSDGDPAPNGDPKNGQLTREQLAALPPEERLKAVKDGRARNLLGTTK